MPNEQSAERLLGRRTASCCQMKQQAYKLQQPRDVTGLVLLVMGGVSSWMSSMMGCVVGWLQSLVPNLVELP